MTTIRERLEQLDSARFSAAFSLRSTFRPHRHFTATQWLAYQQRLLRGIHWAGSRSDFDLFVLAETAISDGP